MTPALLAALAALCLPQEPPAAPAAPAPLPALQEDGLPAREDLVMPGERHFGAIRRLTTSGENAEGYFAWAGDRISYQATVGGRACDQIFVLDLLSGARQLVSTGTGRTTCAFFLPGDRRVIFASTHAASDDCLPPPDYSKGYVWKIYPEYELYIRDLDSWALTPIAPAPGYDAEAVVSPRGDKIVFTSRRDGDLDVYLMDLDGSNLVRLTDELGYDGGPFFSPDGQRIVYRAYHPAPGPAAERYQALLAEDSIEPMALQIMIMDLDGSHKVQVTDNGAANFAPYFHPDGQRIIYCSNQGSASGREFDLYLVNADGSGNERITFHPSFDGFPMFSHDGKRLIFASNRANASPRDTNLFLAEWID